MFGGTYMVDGPVIQILAWNDFLNDLLFDLFSQLLGGDGLAMLCADDDRVNPFGYHGTAIMLIFNGDLSLGVRSEPRQATVIAGIGHSLVELVGKQDGQWEVLRGLISSVAEHYALIASAQLFQRLVKLEALCDVRGLLLDGYHNIAGLVIKPLTRIIIANVFDGAANDFLIVQSGIGGDLTKHHDHASLGGGLTCHFRHWIFRKTSIKNSIRDLITNLVGMAFSDGLRGEEEGAGLFYSIATIDTMVTIDPVDSADTIGTVDAIDAVDARHPIQVIDTAHVDCWCLVSGCLSEILVSTIDMVGQGWLVQGLVVYCF